ncbi:MAG: hypothetical protein IH946_05365 [Bacteroidetes bacterium]|nr:hypothetical protein [Bacteroidota bacterium]
MRKVLPILALVVFALSFTSCKKCEDCTYTILGITTTPEEFCGDELDAAKDSGWDCE